MRPSLLHKISLCLLVSLYILSHIVQYKFVVMQSPISQAACIDTFTTMKGLDVYVHLTH